jgi:hypothetical protein
LSIAGKPTTIKGDQASTTSNVGPSASQAVGQSKYSAVEGPSSEDLVSPFSQKRLEGTPPEEKSQQQQQTDQSNTRSPKDNNTEGSGTASPDIATSGNIQTSALKESTHAAEGSRNQEQDGRDVFQSTLDKENQFVETEAQDVGPDELAETNLQRGTDQNNNGPSQWDALKQPAELVPAVQPQSNTRNIGSRPSKDAAGSVQADKKSDSSLRTSEEPEQQVQTEGKTQGGESKAPARKTEQPEERDLTSRNESITSQSQAETFDEQQPSSGTQSRDTDSSKFDGSTDDMKPADKDDNPPSS